ncbi:amino acid adenylation domain protein [Arcobacter nitrofigilis DSM 7299]|uniref:Amino acid adenylation domain protein n=1 Tax=Arcobacter nitrofigilis (strain ATCC 33309 / DSM 7299 / CCUG 15893 / LMG 7604 / NCTC 12251 / CI) TaxID=572480 RepID=D5V0Q0_ARCNC|nr:hybrid non-ribosomal peptide synthetase/type I polyketide synthase [Arcobacter nitrofigilis]ADG93862.1 amino acid adenylation domain protein [Arcobacter nitrofigilis DSM 7299]
MNKTYEPIAIIGTSCRLPGEINDLNDLWHKLSASYDAVVDIPSERCLQDNIYNNTPQVGKSYAKKAGLLNNIANFDAKFFGISDEEATAMDPQQRLLLEAAWHALEDSGQFKNDDLLKETGFYVGIATDDYSQIGIHKHKLDEVSTYTTLGSLRSISAGRVAYHLNLNGPVSQIDTACSSSLMAIHQACQSLRLNEADCMLAGGINLLISPQTMVELSQIKALSLSNRCSVFDNSADGYVRGEGYGLVVLKRLSDAEANNDNIIAVIKGSLTNHDGSSNGLTAPNGLAQEKLLKKTLKISNINSHEVSYVETHGTGTLFGDPIEVNSIINVYGKNRNKDNPLFLGSIKSSIGHLEAAAGVAGILKVCSSITNKQLIPNLNFSTPNPYINWDKAPIKVIDTLKPWSNKDKELRTATMSSFGFSGTNVHMIIQEYQNNKEDLTANKLTNELYIIPISAKSLTSLKNLVKAWLEADYLTKESIANIAYSATVTRKHFEYKLLVLVKNYEDLKLKLKSWFHNKETDLLWSSINFKPLTDKCNINKNYIDIINNYFTNNHIDCEDLYGKNKISHCKLPSYTFDSKIYWWEKPYDFTIRTSDKLIENKNISYKLQWEEYSINESISTNHNIQIIADSTNNNIIKLLEKSSEESNYISQSTNEFLNTPVNKDTNYIYFIHISEDIDILENNIAKIWSIVQYFNKNNNSSKIWIITEQSQHFEKDDITNINASSIWGLFRSLRIELGTSWGGIIDMPQNITKDIINKMFMCFYQQNDEDQYVLRDKKVYIPRLLPHTLDTQNVFSFDLKASYLITGGLGALGIELITYLISLGINHIILASRRGEDTLKNKKDFANKIKEWRRQGKQIDIYKLDLSNELQVSDFFENLKKESINLKGIAHLSGVISKQDLSKSPKEKDIHNFMAAKTKGAWYLHKYSQVFHLDFFLLFSSVTALFGMKDLAFYSASNAFLDALALHRSKQGLKALSINWGRFDIDGMVDNQDAKVLDTLGVAKMKTTNTFTKMTHYMQYTNNICITDVNWDKFTSYFKQLSSINLFTHLLPKSNHLISTQKIETKEHFKKYFIDIIRKALKLEKNKISTTQNLFSIGLNSMLSMYIRQALEENLKLTTEATLFFKKQTIELLVEYLWEQYQNNNNNKMINTQLNNEDGKIIFLFSGQGTQYPGMGKTLYTNNEKFKQSIDYCINFLQKEFDLDFKYILFDDKSKLLKETKYAQLSLFIIEYSLYKLWQEKNIHADYFIGHSVGEYVAACLAGVFSLEDALRLLKVRGKLMQSLENHGDMMVVFDSFENIPTLPNSLDIAAINSPWQTVISGNINHLKNYEKKLSEKNIKTQLLNTQKAFHSSLMMPILKEFQKFASTITYKSPNIPIITNINATVAKEDIACAKYWVDHIINTVQFAPSIQKAYEKGCRYFIEVGPGSVLKNLAEENIIQKNINCHYFNSLINEDKPKEYLLKQQEKLKLSQKSLINHKDDSIKENLLRPIIHNEQDKFKPFALTSMQHAYWLGRNEEIAEGGVAIHMYLELDIKYFNKENFTNAWKTLVERHDMLHAIVDRNGEQQILKQIPEFSILEHSLKNKDENEKEIYLEDIRHELSHQNVSLEKWPQSEIRITKLDDNNSRVHISIDGWTIDGWSYQVLFHELHELYHNPKLTLPTINISFRDYVLQLKEIENSAFYQKHLTKWRERLKVLPKAPQLPMNKNKTNTNRFKRWEYFINKEQYASLKKYASDKSLTTVTTLLSAYAWVLSRYSKEQDITLNIPRFNRLPLHSDINRVIGEFASFTLLACTRKEDTTFNEYANKIQKQLWEDVENPWVPGVTLLRELAKISNQSNTMMPFVFTNMPEESLDGKKLEFLNEWSKSADIPYFLTQTPQVQVDCQYHDKDDGLFVFWDVLIDKFEPEIIDNLFSSYIDLIQNLSSSDKAWNQNSLPMKKSSSLIANEEQIPKQGLYEQFTNTAQKNKKNIAIYSENKTLTYEDLYIKSQKLGTYIKNNINFKNETPTIAIIMNKGWQQIVAVMCTLASGAIFLPLDSNLPKDRMQYALQNANTKMVISKENQISQIKEKLENIDIPLISIDDESLYKTSEAILPIKYEDLVCIIYTSGSTGLPKGVMVTQKALINNINYTNNRFKVDTNDAILSLTPIYHDLVLFDIFGALTAGASIVIPEEEKRKDPEHWLALIKQYRVSIWNSVPTMMEMLIKFSSTNQIQNKQLLSSLRLCILGGDWIPLTIPPGLKELNTKTTLVSIGGPTETTVWNIMYEIKEFDTNWKSIPYGKPITNTTYYILNDLLEECPIGVTGELYVSGISLAAGYINDLEKTQEVFINHPKTKERMYKTGDLGKLLSNGLIEFMGRSDNQVQISGYRIELSEIESLAHKQIEINRAQALLIKDNNTPHIALVYSCNDGDISENKLKEQLKASLPQEIIPKKLLKIKQFPLTVNGKIDRNALIQLLNTKNEQHVHTKRIVENEIQKHLMSLWQKHLQRENIGLYENFFEAGGNSLLATELFIQIRQEFPIINSVVLLYEHTSIYELSQFIEKQTTVKNVAKKNTRGLQRRKRLLAKN